MPVLPFVFFPEVFLIRLGGSTGGRGLVLSCVADVPVLLLPRDILDEGARELPILAVPGLKVGLRISSFDEAFSIWMTGCVVK